MKKGGILTLLIWLFLIVGEIKCVVKIFQCNWSPVGKAEILYTGAALTGLGSIVGWINIEDE